MTDRHHDLEERCVQALREHVAAGDEETLHRAYEFGRQALGEGVGVMEMALLLRRAALYRAAQEALSNVARHARASSATIEVSRTEREVVCRIRDDGWGFDPEAAA